MGRTPKNSRRTEGNSTNQPDLKPEPASSAVPTLSQERAEDPGYKINGAETKVVADKLSITLTPEGAALPSTRESNWQKLKDMIERTPGARERLLGTAAVPGGLIEAKQIEPFYTGIGLINVFLAARILKLDTRVAGAIIPYTQDELTLMSEATAAAVNENLDKCPAWLLNLLRGGGSVAFAKLAMVLFQVHAQKFQLIRNAMAEMRESQQQPGAVN